MQSVVPAIFRRLWTAESEYREDLNDDERWLKRRTSLFVALLLAISGFAFGADKYLSNLENAQFYQHYFSPALTFYCTGELRQAESVESVRQFLTGGSPGETICEEVLPNSRWTSFDRDTSYFYLASALLWKVLGLSWSSLWPLAGLGAAALTLAAFGLVRLFTPSSLLAALLAIAVLTNRHVAEQIPHLRDFSKAPFIVGALALLGSAVLRPGGNWHVFLKAAAAGAIVALAMGFRPDALVVAPVAAFCPLLFLLDGKKSFVQRTGMVWGGFAVGFLLLQVPHLIVAGPPETAGSLFGHFFMQGFAPYYMTGMLHIPTADYIPNIMPHDEYVMAKANLFVGSGEHWTRFLHSPGYSDAVGSLFAGTVLAVPYDVFLRLFYTADTIGQLPINKLIWGLPLLALVPVAAVYRPRSLLFLAGSFALLIAPQSLLPHPRHGFYLVVFGAAFIALLIAALYRLAIDRTHWKSAAVIGGRRLRVFAITAAALGFAVAGVSFALSRWQADTLRSIADQYRQLDWQDVPFELAAPNAIRPTEMGEDMSMMLHRVEIETNPMTAGTTQPADGRPDCAASETISMTHRYAYAIDREISEKFETTGRHRHIALFFTPARFSRFDFKALELGGISAECVSSWSVARNFPAGTVPMEMILHDGELRSFQQGNWRDIARRFVR